MAMQTLNVSTGPRAGRKTSQNISQRGGIQKRGQQSTRVDRDGDLDMDGASTIKGRGRGTDNRRNNPRATAQGFGGHGYSSRDPRPARVDPTSVQKAVLRQLGTKDSVTKGARNFSRPIRSASNNAGSSAESLTGNLEQIIVYGLKESKAASNPGGGVKDLLDFLERKASPSNGSNREAVRIRKSRDEGDALIISVRSEDAHRIIRLNSYQFAGATLSIKPYQPTTSNTNTSASTEGLNVTELLKSVLDRRYNGVTKILDLSSLGQDPQLINIGMFSSNTTTSKFFPALMKVCDSVFATEQQKTEAVPSISLAGNDLATLDSVTTLAQTFPNLKNLDLSNNQFKSVQSLNGWREKFRNLEHIVLAGNPLIESDPTFIAELVSWYPGLRHVGTTQVRSEEEVRAARDVQNSSIPTAPASFQDDMDIAKNFLTHFFPAFDGDRLSLIDQCYGPYSRFSMSVNNSALRDQSTPQPPPMSWEQYIRSSRNLKKLKNPHTRANRLYMGQNSIKIAFNTFPPTRHPSLATEPGKWCIECHRLPGVPDHLETPGGVNGLLITAHGEYTEANDKPWNRNSNRTRSFDRTLVLGPGPGALGIRVVSDMINLRAYGGTKAFEFDQPHPVASDPKRRWSDPDAPLPQHILNLPAGFGMPVEGKSEEQVMKENLAVRLTTRTGMTIEYSGLCLNETGWDLDAAARAFEGAKANLPQDAFIQLYATN